MSVIQNELLYETYYEEVVEEATLTGTLAMYSQEDLHIATMNKFHGV